MQATVLASNAIEIPDMTEEEASSKRISKTAAGHLPESGTLASGFYTAYESYSRLLRTWLVAYGIGGPVLLLSNEVIWTEVTSSESARLVGVLFLGGVLLQVTLAGLNKCLMWIAYYAEVKHGFKDRKAYMLVDKLSEQFWIDFVVDTLTVILFGIATMIVFVLVTAP